MECPACNRNMRQMTVNDITVDICENGCGGIWFDNFELMKVDEKHESAGEPLLDIARDPSVMIDPSKVRLCPKCDGQKMIKHFRSVKGEIEIDDCPACGGVFLDQGELGEIRNQFENDDARRQAAKEYFADAFGEQLDQMRAEGEASLKRARKFANAFKFICPSYYIPGKQSWGAF